MTYCLGRIATTLTLLAATGMSAAGTAAATPPDRFTVHIDDTFLSGTSEDCGFDILLHLEGSIRVTDYYDRAGELSRSLETYPALFYTFINPESGVSVTSRSPDPGHYTWHSDGSATLTVTGLVMHLGVSGSSGKAIQAGRFVIRFDAAGNPSESERVGANDDYHAALCDILAP